MGAGRRFRHHEHSTEASGSEKVAEPYLQRLSDLVDDLDLRIEAEGDLECRHFFGGAALYLGGSICASLTPVGLAMKLAPNLREALLESGRGQPLQYFEGGRVKKEYVLLPERLLANASEMRALFRDCFRYVGGT